MGANGSGDQPPAPLPTCLVSLLVFFAPSRLDCSSGFDEPAGDDVGVGGAEGPKLEEGGFVVGDEVAKSGWLDDFEAKVSASPPVMRRAPARIWMLMGDVGVSARKPKAGLPPAVTPSWMTRQRLVVSTVTSPSAPVKAECWEVVPRRNRTCLGIC